MLSRLASLPAVLYTAAATCAIAFRQTQLALRERSQLRSEAAALARQREQAEAASEAKSAFLAYMSHEIRTPLNAVVGLAELAQGPEVSAPQRAQHLEMLRDSARHLSGVISDVLDFSRIESGKMPLDDVAFDLDALIGSLATAHRVLAERKGLAFVLQVQPPNLGWVHHDPTRLRQILNNFLSNALKFTARGEIRLAIEQGPGRRFRFTVTDTGAGIAPDEQARLFTPYVQAGAVAERSVGSGLGLSICRELAVLMGGEVGAQSTLGEGSSFWLSLELPEAAPAHAAGLTGMDAPHDGLRGRRVLVADDVASNQVLMEGLLRREGALPVVVGSGAEAVAEVQRQAASGVPFELVFLDVQMPGMSGLEAARRIRQLGGAAGEVAIVALSGGVSDEERLRAREAGMNEFLAKPLSLKRLRAAAARVLRDRPARDGVGIRPAEAASRGSAAED
jgi:signal transduction histidine kinase/FixJ family two-component response regulator